MAEEQPKAEEKKGPSPEVRQDQSRRDRREATLERELRDTQKQLAAIQSEHEETRTTLEMLREQAKLGEDEEQRIKVLAERERKMSTREKTVAEAEKRATARLLHAEYGTPLDELLEHDDPRDMEIAALKWDKTQAAKAANKPREQEEEEAKPAKVDTGSATRTAPNWADFNMNTKEGREAFDRAAADLDASRKRAQRTTT